MAKLTTEQRKDLHIKARRVRIAFPRVFTAEENQQNDSHRKEYSVQIRWMMNDPEHVKQVEALKAAMGKAAEYFWKDDAKRNARDAADSKNTRFLREDKDGGFWFVNVKRREEDGAPRVVGRDKTQVLKQEDGKIYGGCYCNVIFDIWCYGGMTKGGTKAPYGYSGTLLGMQFVEDGEPFGGSSQAKDEDFDDLADAGDSDGDDFMLP